jgi:zinc D-Ala-D-Ala carboxypeptidase
MRYTPETWPSDAYPNFSYEEMSCSHSGDLDIDPGFMDMLQSLRDKYGKPMTITSAYRSPMHPIEMAKPAPGSHSKGVAVDIAVSGEDAYHVLRLAFLEGFLGIGVSQKGSGRFLHLDMTSHVPRPRIWSY